MKYSVHLVKNSISYLLQVGTQNEFFAFRLSKITQHIVYEQLFGKIQCRAKSKSLVFKEYSFLNTHGKLITTNEFQTRSN